MRGSSHSCHYDSSYCKTAFILCTYNTYMVRDRVIVMVGGRVRNKDKLHLWLLWQT